MKPNVRRYPLKDRHFSQMGFTMTELLVSIGLGAILILATMGILSLSSKQNLLVTLTQTRAALKTDIGRSIKKIKSIQDSAANAANASTKLNSCIEGIAGTLTADCNGGVAVDITLVNESGNVIAGPGVLYNSKGGICTSDCAFSATATYFAECGTTSSGIEATCDRAKTINISVTISLLSTVGYNLSPIKVSTNHIVPLVDLSDVSLGAVSNVGVIPVWTAPRVLGFSPVRQWRPSADITFGYPSTFSTSLTSFGNFYQLAGPPFGLALRDDTQFVMRYDNANRMVTYSMNVWTSDGVTKGPMATGDTTAFVSTVTPGSFSANAFTTTSDLRLKTNVKDIEDLESRVSRVNVYDFLWKKDHRKDLGFIAQEMEKQFPELVSVSPDGFKAVKYSNFIAVLLNYVKLNRAKNDELLKKQEEKIEQLNHMMERSASLRSPSSLHSSDSTSDEEISRFCDED